MSDNSENLGKRENDVRKDGKRKFGNKIRNIEMENKRRIKIN